MIYLVEKFGQIGWFQATSNLGDIPIKKILDLRLP